MDHGEELVATARSLLLDLVTAEISDALEAAAIPGVLLKGPAIARRLYTDGAFRPYNDVDILVDPASLERAREVLSGLGFADLHADTSNLERISYAEVWIRSADEATVDLHVTLEEAAAPATTVWSVLSAHTEVMPLGATSVRVLDDSALALLAALHMAHHGAGGSKPREDLRRALSQLPTSSWSEGATLADAIGGRGAFVAGLSMVPEGNALLASLDLEAAAIPVPLFVALRAGSAPATSEGLARLLELRGVARLRLLARQVVPTPAAMRLRWPMAERGKAGLALAYVQRSASRARSLGPGLRAVLRARRKPPSRTD